MTATGPAALADKWRLRGDVPWPECPCCGSPFVGESYQHWMARQIKCEQCDGIGYLEVPITIEALLQTERGSSARVAIYSARRAAGICPVQPYLRG